jgi:hypothetical protein
MALALKPLARIPPASALVPPPLWHSCPLLAPAFGPAPWFGPRANPASAFVPAPRSGPRASFPSRHSCPLLATCISRFGIHARFMLRPSCPSRHKPFAPRCRIGIRASYTRWRSRLFHAPPPALALEPPTHSGHQAFYHSAWPRRRGTSPSGHEVTSPFTPL